MIQHFSANTFKIFFPLFTHLPSSARRQAVHFSAGRSRGLTGSLDSRSPSPLHSPPGGATAWSRPPLHSAVVFRASTRWRYKPPGKKSGAFVFFCLSEKKSAKKMYFFHPDEKKTKIRGLTVQAISKVIIGWSRPPHHSPS